MSDRLPYEEQLKQQLNDLPLPDESKAWVDMKRRLEEDDDDSIIPIWLRGCGLWGLLLIVFVGIGWWLFRQTKNENKKAPASIQQEAGLQKRKDQKTDSVLLVIAKPPKKEYNRTGTTVNKNDPLQGKDEIQKDQSIAKNEKETLTEIAKKAPHKTKIERHFSKQLFSKSTNDQKSSEPAVDNENSNNSPVPRSKPGNNPGSLKEKKSSNLLIKDLPEVITAEARSIDSSIITIKDSVKKKSPEERVKNNVSTKDSSKQRSISFSAGIAMYQLLPVDGQKLTPYNSQGRKGSLADYIPSVFFRMYRNDKWFIQSEFRYGAPQYNRELVYQQENKVDTFGITNTITSAKLKKTFYHQLPVSFNYFVLPNLSIGGGFVWNSFSGAVSEQDIVQRTISTGIDTVLGKGVILGSQKADSNFAKSYFQALVETQYRWKRFSLGARYSFGLQPYLKFKLPGGTQQNERNRTLQVFFRYELWKSKTNR